MYCSLSILTTIYGDSVLLSSVTPGNIMYLCTTFTVNHKRVECEVIGGVECYLQVEICCTWTPNPGV